MSDRFFLEQSLELRAEPPGPPSLSIKYDFYTVRFVFRT